VTFVMRENHIVSTTADMMLGVMFSALAPTAGGQPTAPGAPAEGDAAPDVGPGPCPRRCAGEGLAVRGVQQGEGAGWRLVGRQRYSGDGGGECAELSGAGGHKAHHFAGRRVGAHQMGTFTLCARRAFCRRHACHGAVVCLVVSAKGATSAPSSHQC
jgi:hypothetical protein